MARKRKYEFPSMSNDSHSKQVDDDDSKIIQLEIELQVKSLLTKCDEKERWMHAVQCTAMPSKIT